MQDAKAAHEFVRWHNAEQAVHVERVLIAETIRFLHPLINFVDLRDEEASRTRYRQLEPTAVRWVERGDLLSIVVY